MEEEIFHTFSFFFVLSNPNQHFIYVALLYSCSAPQLDVIPTKSNQAWLEQLLRESVIWRTRLRYIGQWWARLEVGSSKI